MSLSCTDVHRPQSDPPLAQRIKFGHTMIMTDTVSDEVLPAAPATRLHNHNDMNLMITVKSLSSY